MAQNTVAGTAYNQLRPLEGTNLGAILEEHTRYHQKRKDDEEAKKQAQKAQQAKFLATQNKDALAIYEGIQPSESEGFLNTQIIESFERNKEKYKDLARAYANGNLEAGLQLKEIGKKYENLVLANTTYSKKAQSLAELQKQGIYNEYLDAETDAFKTAVANSMYKVNDDLSIDIFDPSQGRVVNMPNGSLLNNSYLQTSFHPKAKFEEYGKDIASTLLDNNYGQKIENNKAREEGIRLVKGVLGKDDVERRSFLSYVRKGEVRDAQGNVVKFQDEDGNPLTMAEIGENDAMATKFASLYYDNFVSPRVQEQRVDNTTKETAAERENRTFTNVGVATNEDGTRLISEEYSASDIPTGNIFYIKDYNSNTKGVWQEAESGNKRTRYTLQAIGQNPNGVDMYATKTEMIPRINDYGETTGYAAGRTEKVVLGNSNEEKIIKNQLAAKIYINGRSPKDLSELPALLRNLEGETEQPKTNSTSTNKPKFN